MSILDNQQKITEDANKMAKIYTRICNRYRILKVWSPIGIPKYMVERKCRLFGFGPRVWLRCYCVRGKYLQDPRIRFSTFNFLKYEVYDTTELSAAQDTIRECIKWDLEDVREYTIINVDTSILKD